MRQNILVGLIFLGALVGPHLLACDEEPDAVPEPSPEPEPAAPARVLSDFGQCMADTEAKLLSCSHAATTAKEIQECASAYDWTSMYQCLPKSPREKIIQKRQAEILARAEMDDWMFDDKVPTEIILCPEDDIGPAICLRNSLTGDVY